MGCSAAPLRPYNARWYDPALGRFVQPDTAQIDPGDPQQLNKFSYVRNNPVLYRDPTGHRFIPGVADEGPGWGPNVNIVRGGPNFMDDFNGALQGFAEGIATRVGACADVAALTVRWFTETGPEHVVTLGSSTPFVQLLQHEEGVNAAREAFKAQGCPSEPRPFKYRHDAQQWGTFAREMGQALMTGDPVGAFLGSYEVRIWQGQSNGSGVVFQVSNPTNRESFLRFPGIGPLLQRKTREQTQGLLDNWGGDMYEDFLWSEPSPCSK